MRDPRHPTGPRVTLSEDEPIDTVLPPGQAGTGRRRPSPDSPAHHESRRSAADDRATADDVIAPVTRDIYRRDWVEFAAWCRANGHRMTGTCWEVYGDWFDDWAQVRTDVFYLLEA